MYSVKAKIKSTVTLEKKKEKKRRIICLPDTQGENCGKKCR